MIRSPLARAGLAVALAAAALATGGCKNSDASAAAETSGAPIARIAPPAGKAWADVVATTPDGGHRMGNPNAPIKLVEFGSLSCPHCAHLSQEAAAALRDDFVASGRVSYEYRSFAIHPQDVPLTLMVECAPPASFFPLVEQIYGNFDAMNAPLQNDATLKSAQQAMALPPAQRFPAFADVVGYTRFFAERGLPVDRAHACLADGAKAKAVADLAERFSNAGINQTPTVTINDAKVDDVEWPVIKAALENAGAR